MSNEIAKSVDTVAAGLVARTQNQSVARAGGIYFFECVGADGYVKWTGQSHNLVVNEGLQNMVAAYLDAATQTTTWYLGLVTGPGSGTTIAAADTLASHAGWTEFSNYTGSRKTATFGTATTADPSVISTSSTSFSITGAGGTVAGAFLASAATGTSGILFSASDFQSPGDRAVVSGDTLNVTYTFSLDAT